MNVRNCANVIRVVLQKYFESSEVEFGKACSYVQVCKVFTSYAEGSTLKVVMLAGQRSFAAEQTSLSEHRCVQKLKLDIRKNGTPSVTLTNFLFQRGHETRFS